MNQVEIEKEINGMEDEISDEDLLEKFRAQVPDEVNPDKPLTLADAYSYRKLVEEEGERATRKIYRLHRAILGDIRYEYKESKAASVIEQTMVEAGLRKKNTKLKFLASAGFGLAFGMFIMLIAAMK